MVIVVKHTRLFNRLWAQITRVPVLAVVMQRYWSLLHQVEESAALSQLDEEVYSMCSYCDEAWIAIVTGGVHTSSGIRILEA